MTENYILKNCTNSIWYLILLGAIFLTTGCLTVEEEKLTEIKVDTSDPAFQQIYTLQDKQDVDSLYTFFNHKDPSYRYSAALAFGSIKGEKAKAAIDSLSKLLQDEISGVRVGAAYALGQTEDSDAAAHLLKAFQSQDSLSENVEMNSMILEAIGKTGDVDLLRSMSTAKHYLRSDTLLLEGLAKGIYRFALRNIVAKEGTARMVDFLAKPGYPNSVRLVAANYLSRARNIAIDSFATTLISVYNLERDPDIKMALAIGIGKTKEPIAIRSLIDAMEIESDYRVKCNIIRALGNFDYGLSQASIYKALKDPNPHVSSAAAQFFHQHGIRQDADVYWRNGRDTSIDINTRIRLYKAANKWMPFYKEITHKRVNSDLKNRFQTVLDPEERSLVLDALSEYGWNHKYIFEEGYAIDNNLIKTAAASALSKISNRPDFDAFFGGARRNGRRALASYFTQIINDGNVGPLSEAAQALANASSDYKTYIEDHSFLTAAQLKLELPRDVEAYNFLQAAIDYFNGKDKTIPTELEYNHPIDWRLVNSVSNDSEAVISTNKGEITIRLMPEAAPGSVANFVQLATNGFYNNKTFHRVVSNFVVQAGCPRGDGYGSLDYSIRSELPPISYNKGGFVGMASAGNHTECTQWFITHSPTLHLDGRYTIFATVVEGMNVVHQILPGDIIQKITIDN